MSYQSANEAKATFDDLYATATPHRYFSEMNKYGYAIGEQAKPYFQNALRYLQHHRTQDRPVHLLDLGCSYGIGAALVKYHLSFYDLMDFFAEQAPRDYRACVDLTQRWLHAQDENQDVTCVGADCSEEAIRFASESGLLDQGIARNFEEGQEPTEREIQLLRRCTLLASTGAIGYVGPKTLSVLLRHLGKAHPAEAGPVAVVTILRMFDPEPIRRTFEDFGYHFDALPGIHLRQRRFTDKAEQDKTLNLLEQRGVGAEGLEQEGILYADLYLGAPPDQFAAFHRWVGATRIRQSVHTPSDTTVPGPR